MSKSIPSISKYMTMVPTTIEPGATLAAAAVSMKEHRVRHLPVVNGDGELLGIISERDISFVQSFSIVDPLQVTVGGAMIEKPYIVGPDTPLDEVVATMAEHKYGSAVIVQNKQVVGVFTTVDACRALSELLSSRLKN